MKIGIDYLICCTNKKPIILDILEYKIYNNKLFVKKENDSNIKEQIIKKVLKEKP